MKQIFIVLKRSNIGAGKRVQWLIEDSQQVEPRQVGQRATLLISTEPTRTGTVKIS